MFRLDRLKGVLRILGVLWLLRVLGLRGKPGGIMLIILSSFFYAGYNVCAKLIIGDLGGSATNAWRCGIVLVVLLVIAKFGGHFQRIHWRDWFPLLLLVVSAAVVWRAMFYALSKDGIAVASAVYAASLLLGTIGFGYIVSWWKRWRAQKTGREIKPEGGNAIRILIAVILGIGGLLLVYTPKFGVMGWLGLGCAVLAGQGDGLNTITKQNLHKRKHRPYNLIQTNILVQACAVLGNVVVAWCFHERMINWSGHVWIVISVFAACSLLGSTFSLAGSKLLSSSLVAVFSLSEIVLGVWFGLVLFHEHVALLSYLGVGIIIVAMLVPEVGNRKRKAPSVNVSATAMPLAWGVADTAIVMGGLWRPVRLPYDHAVEELRI